MHARLAELLSAKQAKYEVLHDGGAPTAQERAAATHTSGWSFGKVVIVKERDGLVMAVLPACCVLDLDRLKGLLAHGEIRLATPEEIHDAIPDCAPGAIPPFGALFGIRTFLDRALLDAREITVPAGDPRTLLRMRTTEFRRLADARVGDFAVFEPLARAGGGR
ncbi:MAG: hypothetical protein A3E31_10065 [Candidatus Rokubacteria bacterium RIFCSPHIGHO2_12_FULL_73_22]|nr:MAG: hypothetical protein A3D33_14725 [Candidatus Rokubacteria bacterium RIFCSPHIGHO2_02_FULL_73_26]OGK98482.1 MAG: hypothetical protein A3E31_10065 [Candidatus Rokubacteria bacterium RIFCSPHIGHO2_12_FULL_73_22]OGL07910.1 MAG: hypothetical protein A3I14_08325 [Candidatus Rokubacteria bacterium RIFCSPLOWO2_02_FULL_73_56]OGL21407.1 MAG: hypothetical protein A3G44_13580 [Candidatus Rokubacteria bacterium RIFCSPLOWO2_12_FULL_73_47]